MAGLHQNRWQDWIGISGRIGSEYAKVEAIHGERFATRQKAKKQVFEYIEIYYNRKRLTPVLGTSPQRPSSSGMWLN